VRSAVIHVGPVDNDAAAYGSQGNAILGTPDSGRGVEMGRWRGVS